MNKILLASHGYLAQGMKSSLEILMGTNDRIEWYRQDSFAN